MYQLLQGLAFMHKHGFFHRCGGGGGGGWWWWLWRLAASVCVPALPRPRAPPRPTPPPRRARSDIKPENCLVRGDDVKIADFGLAREIRSRCVGGGRGGRSTRAVTRAAH